MKILVVGAGAIGGYLGGRLLAVGRDVTFLVRPRRAEQLARTGIVIRSQFGDVERPAPTVTADRLAGPADLVLLSCKAYDLEGAIDSFAPAVGPQTAILPLLNGMRHIDVLDARFGAGRVLGGLCFLSATLDPEGRVLHLNNLHNVTFGDRQDAKSARIGAIADAFAGALLVPRVSDDIMQEMWEKWMFIAASAGITCLMRAAQGDIVNAGGAHYALGMVEEAAAVAASHGFSPRAVALENARAMFNDGNSTVAASMMRDMERGSRIEADHILGNLLDRAGDLDTPLLRIAYTHLKSYAVRQARENPTR